MKYKGIEYRVLQTTSEGTWAWSFDPPNAVPIHGKTTGHRPKAVATVQMRIDMWLKDNADDESEC
jgi:hypothetical protein